MNNLAALTHSHTLLAAKKRAKRHQLTEIIFDDDARRDFLTGFHKRKLAKADAARKKAQEREKQVRLESRREHRRALREQAAENARKVESAYADLYELPGDDDSDESDDSEWSGIPAKGKSKQRDEEYEDDQVLATVTVVEDFDPDTIRHGPLKSSLATPPPPPPPHPNRSTNKNTTTLPEHTRPFQHSKPQKIRYQTKEARKAEHLKQLARRTEKAERAGGRAARRNSASKKKSKSRG